MHKKSDFQWTPEAEEAFKQMKKLIAELPTLTAPRGNEELIIYLAAAKEAISAVLMTDRIRSHYTMKPNMNTNSRSLDRRTNGCKELASKCLTQTWWPIKLSALTSAKEKSINEKEILEVVNEEGNTWMTPICEYLTKEILPEDTKKARAGVTSGKRGFRFVIDQWNLYKKSFLGPWLRFGLPGEIISDNGKQFRDNPFKDWCEKLCIRQCFASVKHPQAIYGSVERANRSLGEGIKARLDEKSKDWIEELPHVLWAHRTMIKSSNGETPFSLTYGTEAVIPAEIGMPTLRTAEMDQTKNNEALGINLDLIEERREQAAIQEAKKQEKDGKIIKTSDVLGTSFKPGDMVYRSNEASHAKDEGKLGPKWEGPYEVKESLGKGAYKLKDCKGNEIPRTWNICNLKIFYHLILSALVFILNCRIRGD
ncbi:reverse transcriptase domain-containing protein [Tanacetum coccineum]|uniref:Reverse transcriptase domain-containing protein n=1 Tax=Tanacetum coccineum TaxID=301880 RepID=A0ABQ4ZVY7_9ASTR